MICITHTINFRATWLKISGDMTLVSGDITSGEMTGDLTSNPCITILSDHFSWKLSGDWLLFAGGSFKTDLFCGWFVPYIRDMIGFSVVQVVIKPRKVVELQISANKTPLIQTTRRLRKVSVLAGCPYQVGHVISVRKSPFVGTKY